MSVHAIYLSAHSIELTPSRSKMDGADWRELPNSFGLSYKWKEDAEPQYHSHVYIVPAVQELIRKGEVKAFELHTLWRNSPAHHALPEGPNCVILSVTLADGRVVGCTPPELASVRRRLFAWSAAGALAGAAVAFAGFPLVGGFFLGLATHKLRSALEVPKSEWKYGSTVEWHASRRQPR